MTQPGADLPSGGGAAQIRLAELLASLSLATDLGTAFPLEKALRNALIAVGIGHELGLSAADRSDVYYTAMLRFLGCSAFAHELAAAFGGDDNRFHATYEPVDVSRPSELIGTTLQHLAEGGGPLERAAAILRFLTQGRQLATAMQAADCEAADRLALRLDLSRGVRQGLAHVWTRWDGQGQPAIGGDAIALPARVALVANLAELFLRFGGRAAAVEVVRRRRGAHLDPNVADAFLGAADRLLEPVEAESVWDTALEAEPRPYQCLAAAKLDAVAAAFADFADLKSIFTLGHSSGVARLAEAAARTLGLAEADVALCRRAGLVHDLGRVGLPDGIWEKRGPLTAGEWERVRLHAYYTERVLMRATALQPLAQVAGMHHERRDGSGYHRALGAAGLSVPARVLAASDAYHAMTEDRPHRPARPPAEAARELAAAGRAGALDPEVVRAVMPRHWSSSRRACAASRPSIQP